MYEQVLGAFRFSASSPALIGAFPPGIPSLYDKYCSPPFPHDLLSVAPGTKEKTMGEYPQSLVPGLGYLLDFSWVFTNILGPVSRLSKRPVFRSGTLVSVLNVAKPDQLGQGAHIN